MGKRQTATRTYEQYPKERIHHSKICRKTCTTTTKAKQGTLQNEESRYKQHLGRAKDDSGPTTQQEGGKAHLQQRLPCQECTKFQIKIAQKTQPIGPTYGTTWHLWSGTTETNGLSVPGIAHPLSKGATSQVQRKWPTFHAH